MSQVLVNESSLQAIADAIRSKNGKSTTYKPSAMAAAINALSGSLKHATGTFNWNSVLTESTNAHTFTGMAFKPLIFVFFENSTSGNSSVNYAFAAQGITGRGRYASNIFNVAFSSNSSGCTLTATNVAGASKLFPKASINVTWHAWGL